MRLHDATKLMRHATCNKIALCKRAYLCDMRLLHAVAGKLKSSNFLATIACRKKGAFTRCDKTDATCDKIALCKRAYLCDMRLLHAVAGKLKSSNFLATIACRNKPFT